MGIFPPMAELSTTSERPTSKARDEIIREAKRIEQDVLCSAKSHFVAAHFWARFHLLLGVPVVAISAVAGAAALAQFDATHILAGMLAIGVSALSAVMTFLNPNEKASAHLNAGNRYDSLRNQARIFWTIECWGDHSDQVLTERVRRLSELKDDLNKVSPQAPPWAYRRARKGIDEGEAEYAVDQIAQVEAQPQIGDMR
jgi:hypothetical protein